MSQKGTLLKQLYDALEFGTQKEHKAKKINTLTCLLYSLDY
jgi:hypothetical protein